MESVDFVKFPKIARLSRGITITEKIDGTNGQICIGENGEFKVASRKRFLTLEKDNFGFAAWAYAHKEELIEGLGPGRHFGEWWGAKIQRGYNMKKQVFSLFDTSRWNSKNVPKCCDVVPVLMSGSFLLMDSIGDWTRACMLSLRTYGSQASPRYMNPEGIVIRHEAANVMFKKTFEDDITGKGNDDNTN